jgi:hypothetical protein
MLKRSIRCTVWILGALLVLALLDSIPDPPAVNPHTVTVKVASARAESVPQHSSSPDLLAQFRTGRIFVEDTEPDCPSTLIAEEGQASDPSPPALLDRSQS